MMLTNLSMGLNRALILCVTILLIFQAVPLTSSYLFSEAAGESEQERGFEGGTTIYVDDDAAEGGNGSEEKPYRKIQYGIDNATAGDTVRVLAGTYNENVIFNKTLSVIGDGQSDTIIDGGGSGYGVSITNDSSNLSGFRVQNCGAGYWDAGVRIGAENCSVSGIYSVENNHGISAMTTTGGYIENNTCINNTRDGIYLYNSNEFKVTNNSCTENRYGISLNNADSSLILLNSCENNTRGIQMSNADRNVIWKNDLLDQDRGILLSNSGSNEVSENTISGHFYGVFLSMNGDNNFTNNEITYNTHGIGIDESDGNLIEGNTISNNEEGVELTLGSQNNIIVNNDITGNRLVGVNASGNEDRQVDARNNWWGDSSGPYHKDSNPQGLGDNVTDFVRYDPWEGKAKKVYNPRLDEHYVSIQDGIDSASEGDTIRVYEGTFNERIVVNKALIIRGNGTGETTVNGGGGGDVVTLDADDIEFKDFTIMGGGTSGAGVQIQSDWCQVFDNHFQGNYKGLTIEGGTTNTISQNTFSGNDFGIVLSSSNGNAISDNQVDDSLQTGIGLYSSSDNVIMDNHVERSNGTDAVFLSYSNYNHLQGNDILYNPGWAIHTTSSVGNNITFNYLDQNSDGINLDKSRNTLVFWNDVINTTGIGCFLMDADRNTIQSNEISFNGDTAIFVGEGSDENTIKGNECKDGDGSGIHLNIAHYNSLEDNICVRNDEFGLRIIRSQNTVVVGDQYSWNSDGVEIYDSDYLSLKDVAVEDNTGIGIDLEDVIGFTLSFSLIQNNDEAGLQANHTTNTLIERNTFASNKIGILVGQDVTNFQVHENNILDNTDIGVDASAITGRSDGSRESHRSDRSGDGDTRGRGDSDIDATNNFWGHTTGPYHPAGNPGGEGDEVSDNVLFDPWVGEQILWADIELAEPLEILNGETVSFTGAGYSHHSSILLLVWSSSIDGEIYNGTEHDFSISTLSNGTHTISLRVQDIEGDWSLPDTVEVHVNGIPVVSLDSLPDWTLEGSDLILEADVIEDSALVKYEWKSSKEGLLYNGSSAQFPWYGLSKGDRVLTVRVMDDRGIWSDPASKNFSVYSRPEASIMSISPIPLIHSEAMYFTASGSGDNPIEMYIWSSDVDGEFYNGSSHLVTYSGLSNGTHQISLRVVDEKGVPSEEVTKNIFVNLAPQAAILNVHPTPAAPGESITFVGNSSDDGTVKNYVWSSDLDGVIYNGSKSTFTYSALSYGTHNITLQVIDDSGIWSKPLHTSVIITLKPFATITSISPNPVHTLEEVQLVGNGTDDGFITAFRWTSSIDGLLITSSSPIAGITQLTPGIHTITLEVQDDKGLWSDPVSTSLDVIDNMAPTLQVNTPADGAKVQNSVQFSGSSFDDQQVSRNEYKIQGRTEWKIIQGDTESWSMAWDSRSYSNGTYTFTFRSYDGLLYSETVTLEVVVANDPLIPDTPEDEDDEIPTAILLMISLGLLVMVVAILAGFFFKSSKSSEDGGTDGKSGKQGPNAKGFDGAPIGTAPISQEPNNSASQATPQGPNQSPPPSSPPVN